MYLKRFFVEGLAHASYLFGDNGEAAVVDPKRDVDDYLAEAEKAGLKIVAIFNSHPHADFASGFRELSDRTGAKIYISHLAPVHYDHVAAKDGDRVKIGSNYSKRPGIRLTACHSSFGKMGSRPPSSPATCSS